MTRPLPKDVSIGRLLRSAFDQYHRLVINLVHDAGFTDLTPAQADVISRMDEAPIRAIDLATSAGVSKQAMSLLAAELVKKSYLENCPDPKDGRARLLVLSKKGQRLKQAGMAAKEEAEKQLLSRLDDHEKQNLVDYLQRTTSH